jgi:hypothetical protein
MPCRLAVLTVAAALAGLAVAAGAGGVEPTLAAAPAAGEKIFRLGVLPSGQPVRALVSGDVPLDGRPAACQTCHQRSGMGTVEGKAWTPPVAGRVLFAARGSGVRMRPPYDELTLERALRKGLDAAGRPLDPLMPRYDLDHGDFTALVAYLRELSARPSPGVTNTEIRFATVVTPDADPSSVRAMMGVLNTFLANRNIQTRNLGKWDQYHRNFRLWRLETWTLAGPPSGWGDQLDQKYSEGPVFALLGGAGGVEWGPVHDFCERHEIPCVLPNLDVAPASAGSGYYTLYFTRGVELEAETIAAELAGEPTGTRVVQFRPPAGPGRAGADALRTALSIRGGFEVVDVVVGSPESAVPATRTPPKQIAVLWLPAGSIGSAFSRRPQGETWTRVFVSSTMLHGEPLATRPLPGVRTDVVDPFSPPSDLAARWPRVATWLRVRGVAPGERLIQDQTLMACVVAGEALMHLNDEFHRDYFLELVDHVGSNPTVSAFHSRLAFGPGQRLLSRGCYVVPVGDGAGPPRWVIP